MKRIFKIIPILIILALPVTWARTASCQEADAQPAAAGAEPQSGEQAGAQTEQGAAAATATPVFHAVIFNGVDSKMIKEILPMISEQLFGIQVEILEITPDIPKDAYEEIRKKYYAGTILEFLKAMKPKDSLGIIGYVAEPIFAGPSPSVNGVGLPDKGAAVVSLAMLADGDYYRFRRRVLSESLHEIGHVYGLEHEEVPYCVMQNTHNLTQLDARETDFCPAHLKQLYGELKKKLPGLKPVDFFKKKEGGPKPPPDKNAKQQDDKKELLKDNIPPELLSIYPDNNAVVDSRLQYMTGRLTDQPDGAGVDPSGILILLDGAQIMFNYDQESGELKARLQMLEPGPHTLEIHAMDRANNAMNPYFATFTARD